MNMTIYDPELGPIPIIDYSESPEDVAAKEKQTDDAVDAHYAAESDGADPENY